VAHGRRLTAADLARALTGRLLLTGHLDRLMERFDVLAMPTVSIEPFAVDSWRPDPSIVDGDRQRGRPAPDGLDWLAWCRAAYPFNLSGQPAISVPAGFTRAGFPVGLQLVGRRHEDALVLRVAAEFERARPWRQDYSRKERL
jgi:aspartyl-tRNA(Asn)/glutamyl-tRNA(Gln) amidotransferase subunit A